MRRRRFIIATLLLFGIMGCAAVERDWKKAEKANSAKAYLTFLNTYPQSEHTAEARQKMEDVDWQDAQRRDSSTAYRNFVRNYPNSKYTQTAKARISQIEQKTRDRQERAFRYAKTKDTIAAYEEFLKNHAQSSYAAEARSRIDRLKELQLSAPAWSVHIKGARILDQTEGVTPKPGFRLVCLDFSVISSSSQFHTLSSHPIRYVGGSGYSPAAPNMTLAVLDNTGNALTFLSAPVNKSDSKDHFDNTGSYMAADGNSEDMTGIILLAVRSGRYVYSPRFVSRMIYTATKGNVIVLDSTPETLQGSSLHQREPVYEDDKLVRWNHVSAVRAELYKTDRIEDKWVYEIPEGVSELVVRLGTHDSATISLP